MRTRRRQRLKFDLLESRRLLATITVNTTDDSDTRDSVLTLREAIEVANGTLAISSLSSQEQNSVSGTLSGNNTIAFNIPGSGVQTIAPTSPLPYITSSVTIDGYTQPGASQATNVRSAGATTDNAVLLIQLSGINAGPSTDGLFLNGLSASNSVIQGLIMNNWGAGGHVAGQPGGRAIVVSKSGGGNVIQGNFIGTDSTGLNAVPNAVGGIQLDHSIADTIGGTSMADMNVIMVGSAGGSSTATSMWGIYVSNSTQATITGNYVGVNAAGVPFSGYSAPAGTYGMTLIDSTGIFVGDAAKFQSNVITSVWIGTLSGTVVPANNFLVSNIIGYDAAQRNPLSGTAGVVILNSAGNVITGNTVAAKDAVGIDVIADNHAANLATLITANIIGANLPTSVVFHQFDGIRLSSSGNTIGGLNPALANTIAHNTSHGVEVYNSPSGTTPTSGFGQATNNQILSNVINDSGLNAVAANAQAPQTPVMKLFSATPYNQTYLLTGVVGNGVPGASYLIQFYADLNPSPIYPAEAELLLTTEKVVAASNGLVLFSTTVAAGRVPAGAAIIADATPATGNTSQFSAGVTVGSPVMSGVNVNITSGTPTVGQPVSIVANVASDAVNWVAPTGKMVIYDNGVALAVTTVVGNGYGYFTIPALTAGSHSIVVKYSGDVVFPGATSAAKPLNGQSAGPRVASLQRITISDNQANIQITFDSPLDASTANNAANYQLIALKPQGNGYVVTGNLFGVTSATYNAGNNTVVITPSIGLSRTTLYALTVVGTSPSGIKNTSGVLLDGSENGSPGTNFYSRV